MLACTHPSLEMHGVSTVACNQSVDKTTANALAVLHAIGHKQVPVYEGQAKPLFGDNVHCEEIHGDTGLDCLGGGRLFPDSPHGPEPEKAVLAIADKIKCLEAAEKLPLQLICTGSLTNAALLLILFPEFASPKYVHVTAMGGALGIGNTGMATLTAENMPPLSMITCVKCSQPPSVPDLCHAEYLWQTLASCYIDLIGGPCV